MVAQKGVTADELVKALKRRKTALPAEIGTFIIFEACEALLSRTPQAVALSSVEISEDGVIALGETDPSSEEGAARSLHAALTSLLVAAGPAPNPALLRLVEEGPDGERWTRDQMRDDLEAALVPLNRTASRRVLSRLVRETTWGDRPPPRVASGPTQGQLDEELSSFLGVPHIPSEPPPEAPKPERRDATVQEEVEDLDAEAADVALATGPARALQDEARTEVDVVPLLPAPSGRPPPLRGLGALSERPEAPPRSKSGVWLGGLLLFLALGLVAVTLVLRPDALARLTGEKRVRPAPELAAPPPPAEPRSGDLIVRVQNERAQILRFVGKGPLTVRNLPTGVAHEFVAIAEGAAPTRALVPSDAEWESTPEGPRYELAMQLAPSQGANGIGDLGETLLPPVVGAPGTTLGSVRIVTTPRGAKVYQLIGFAPEAKLTDVPLGESDELLIWKKGHRPVSRVVAPEDYVAHDGRRVADLTIELEVARR